MRWHMDFIYDRRGFGMLRLHDGGVEWEGMARTGSIDRTGRLVNALEPGEWLIRARTVPTRESAMWVVDPERGWKVRLHTLVNETHWTATGYLIHPDGGLPGTKGCIGLQGTDAPELRDKLDEILQHQATISVYVLREAP